MALTDRVAVGFIWAQAKEAYRNAILACPRVPTGSRHTQVAMHDVATHQTADHRCLLSNSSSGNYQNHELRRF